MKKRYCCQALSSVLLSILSFECQSNMGEWWEPIVITTLIPSYTLMTPTESFSAQDRLNAFVTENFANLTSDMAKGEGQYLNTLADLLEIAPEQKNSFYAMTKAKFKTLVPSAAATPEQLLNNLNIEIDKRESF